MKLYLDDERVTPEGWDRVYTVEEAKAWILANNGKIECVSLDHDLGIEDTGYDLACWIEEMAFKKALVPFKWIVHSANAAGASKMRSALMNADKWW